jgi:NhaA family Na+:H+ antiporter
VAIVDDLGAVAIIALAYTPSLAPGWLAAAAAILAAMALLGRRGVDLWWPYVLLGGLLWYAVLCSGVHATVAGVLAAFTVPLKPGRWHGDSLLLRFEHGLAPWSAYLIVPLFGFANAGVSLGTFSLADVTDPVPLGVALGLFVGKQVGIFGAVTLLVRLGVADLPSGASWRQFYGVALLCGIGFTMSLFIGALAFGDGSHLNDAAKLGVLVGSTLSAVAGVLVLRFAPVARS